MKLLKRISPMRWHKDDLDDRVFSEKQLEDLKMRNHRFRTWASLRVKGRLLIDKYIEEIVPMLTKVHAVQRELEGRRGFIDVIADVKGFGKVLLDNKTSSRPYKPNAVKGDVQLTLYCQEFGIDKAGFIVLNKQISYSKKCLKCGAANYSSHKTCNAHKNGFRCHGTFEYSPEANIQMMIDDVPDADKQMVKASFEQVESCIQKDIYPMNLTACRSYFGKPCPYLNKCLHGDESMLEYKQELKETK
jgi:hypothetical protein